MLPCLKSIEAPACSACLLSLLISYFSCAARGADSPALDDFYPAVGAVYSVLPQPDGKIVIGGSFFSIPGAGYTTIARLNSDATFEPTFCPSLSSGAVRALVLQDDRKIIYASNSGSFVGRLTSEGVVDTNFIFYASAVSAYVSTVGVQEDGKIILGGKLTFTFPVTLSDVIRLSSNGSIDSAFTPHIGSPVNCLALQTDGKCVVGGQFISVNSVMRNKMARLNADGTLDEAFDPNVSAGLLDGVYAAAVQHDGKVVFGGIFTKVGGQPRAGLARVLPDGTLDPVFNPGVTGKVYSIALQTDGKILLGGEFTSVAGQTRQNLARLNPAGSLDPAFTVEAKGSSVSSVAIQKDGKILVAGSFTNLALVNCTNLARLLPTDEPYEVWTRNADELVWLRGGGGPELTRARFEHSSDGATWIPLGEGLRAPGGWKVAGLSAVPAGSAIRGTGYVRGGRYTGSGWWFQSTVNLTNVVPLRILTEDPGFGITDQRFGFKISGPPGEPFRVEASSNLVQWTSVWTNTSASNPVLFSNPQPADAPYLFYRVRYH